MSVDELSRWAVGGGAVIAVKWFVAWYLEDEQWWNEKLSSKNRQLLILLISLILAVGAFSITLLPVDIYNTIEPLLIIIVSTVGVWVTGQTAHKLDKLYRSVVNAQEKKS